MEILIAEDDLASRNIILGEFLEKHGDCDVAFDGPEGPTKGKYFKNVHALPDYRLEVKMETGTTIHFDFRSRLNTVRFGMLKDDELFQSVRTDGNYLIFNKAGKMPVKIAAADFMDLVLIDRRS